MERHLNLIRTEYQEVEKRVLPRFPFSFLMFKSSGKSDLIFEISDISFTGMQLCLKSGEHEYKKDDQITGTVQWRTNHIDIDGTVKWVAENRIGIAFSENMLADIKGFLSIEHVVSSMMPLHKQNVGEELPNNLKFWLRAEGPVELFVWIHPDGEFSKFQFVIFESFLEWEDGKGIKTGRCVTQRNVDTPLSSEGEFTFQLDDGVDFEKVNLSKEILFAIPEDYISNDAREFIARKMGA